MGLKSAGLAAMMLLLLAGGQRAGAITPGINPEADSPTTEDIDLDGIGSDVDLGGQQQLEELDMELTGEVGEVAQDIATGIEDVREGIGGITDTISGIFDRIASIFSLERLLDAINIEIPDILEDPLGGLEGGGESVEIDIGPLGLPDPKAIEAGVENATPSAFEEVSASKTGGEGSPVIKLDLITQFESNMADEVADQSALTEEGQTKLIENAEAATASLEASQALAQDSEGQDVSQNILRNISDQLALQQQTGTLDSVDAQLRARDDALRNKMLVDVVREMQGDRVQDRRQDAAAYSSVITQGAQLILPGAGIDPAGGR